MQTAFFSFIPINIMTLTKGATCCVCCDADATDLSGGPQAFQLSLYTGPFSGVHRGCYVSFCLLSYLLSYCLSWPNGPTLCRQVPVKASCTPDASVLNAKDDETLESFSMLVSIFCLNIFSSIYCDWIVCGFFNLYAFSWIIVLITGQGNPKILARMSKEPVLNWHVKHVR